MHVLKNEEVMMIFITKEIMCMLLIIGYDTRVRYLHASAVGFLNTSDLFKYFTPGSMYWNTFRF